MWVGFLPVPADAFEALSRCYVLGRSFFDQGADEKQRSAEPSGDGYRPYGVEHTDGRPDRLESFAVSGRTDPRSLPAGDEGAGHALRSAMLDAFGRLEPLAEAIMLRWAEQVTGRSMATALRGGLRECSTLQLNCALESAEAEQINTVHDDITVLSLCHAEQPGLEVELEMPVYAPVYPGPQALVALPGKIATLLSGGAIEPVRHRVRGGAAGRRLSLIFFADLQPSRCTPWVETPVNAGVDIGQLVRESPTIFGLPPISERRHGA